MVVAWCVASVSAWADAGWVLTTADFKQQVVSFDGLDGQGVRATPTGGEGGVTGAVAFEQFLSIERTEPPRAAQEKFTLYLLNGDRVVGEPVGVKGESVAWRSPGLGEILVDLKGAKALVRGGKAADPPAGERTEDVVMLANGDLLRGIVADVTSEKLTAQVNNAPVEVPLESVAAVHFALAGPPEKKTDRAFRVRLNDGSAVTSSGVAYDGKTIHLTLSDGSKHALPVEAVSGVEQVNGPVAWLSSQTPDAVVQTPFFGSLSWPTRMDQTVGGKPITFGGKTYARGIGVHAYSRIDFALDGSHEAFRTQYAVAQDEKRQYADVTVRIKVDGTVVHEKEHLKGEVLSDVVTVDLPKGAKKLELEVDYGGANDTQDRFNWIEPALLKKKP